MKRDSLEFLENYLEIYEHDGIDSIFEFFKYYSAFEVTSMFEMKMAVWEFCEYLYMSKLKGMKVKNDKDRYADWRPV